MSEENTKAKYVDLLDKFKENVANSGEDVINGVVTKLTQAEVEKRQEKIIKALEMIQEADKEIKKIKPDQESFDADGKLLTATFTKAKAEEFKKAKKKKADLDEAINLALGDKPDFSKLNNLVK